MAVKLDRVIRRAMEYNYRQYLDRQTQIKVNGFATQVRAAIVKRLEAKWGAPDIQKDMRVLEKYSVAALVTYGIIEVFDPARTSGFGFADNKLAVELKTNILIPTRSQWYANEKPHETYHCQCRDSDPDYAELWAIVKWRRNATTENLDKHKEFAKAIRSTSSYSKIVEMYPFLNEPGYRVVL